MSDLAPSGAALEKIWQEALDVWGIAVTLSLPVPYTSGSSDHWGSNDPLAYIDLTNRQVVVNYELLHAIGAADSLGAVLAHEVGHHVSFPHTLGLSAHLHVMQRKLLPFYPQPLMNLFYDLLVNEVVGRTQATELAAVYQGFNRQSEEPMHPLFAFYLAIYEELWSLKSGTLLPAADRTRMNKQFRGFRGEARIFVQTFYTLEDIYQQFAYFCARFSRFLLNESGEGDPGKMPLAGDVAAPDADDYAGALRGNPQVDAAIEEAVAQGWIPEEELGAEGDDPLEHMNNVLAGMPGEEAGQLRQALTSRIYRSLVDRYLFDLPVVDEEQNDDPFLPTTVLPWELGDDPRRIDWTQSVLTYGPMAAAMPLRREMLADPDGQEQGEVVAVEIYLDTSVSMPRPDTKVNAMTLAAQILGAAGTRKEGRVRGIVYSYENPHISDWMYDEETTRQFLLRFIGGGTQYPFEVLKKFTRDDPNAIRVIISDADFLYNVNHTKGALEVLEAAALASHTLVLLLNLYAGAEVEKTFGALTRKHENAWLVIVNDPGDLATAAASLARALLP